MLGTFHPVFSRRGERESTDAGERGEPGQDDPCREDNLNYQRGRLKNERASSSFSHSK